MGIEAANDVTQLAETSTVPKWIDLQENWPAADRKTFLTDMLIMEDFLTPEEEQKLIEEVDPYMQRLRYEFDHWDDVSAFFGAIFIRLCNEHSLSGRLCYFTQAIHGFRETERQKWYPHNRDVINRVNAAAFSTGIMPYIHVLDLADEGVIKPHVDSSRVI